MEKITCTKFANESYPSSSSSSSSSLCRDHGNVRKISGTGTGYYRRPRSGHLIAPWKGKSFLVLLIQTTVVIMMIPVIFNMRIDVQAFSWNHCSSSRSSMRRGGVPPTSDFCLHHLHPSCCKSSLRWSSTGLFMSAGKSAAGPSGKKKIRNNQNNNNNNNNNSNDRKNKKPQQQQQQQTSKLSKKNENKAKAQEKKRPLPPWQIMSSEDTKENIQDEIQRRQDINKGNLPSNTHALASTITGDVRASSLLLSPTERQLLNWKRFRPERDVESMRFQGAYLDGGGGGSSMPPSMGVPEVAFLGRSNVGKSSLLNRLSKMFTQATSLDTAVVGKTPGATASVNLYILERKQTMKPLMGFVDLPGFGYARLSKDTKESVETAAERYLGKRKELALGILLVDLRRIPSDDDRAVLAALYDMGVPIVVVATKKDKISSQNQILSQMEQVRVGLGLPYGQPLCISSKTGEGVKQLWSIIMDACEDRILELREKVEKGGKAAVVSDDDPESYGTIQLDEEGRFIEDDDQDDVMMEGYEWIQSFARHDNDNDSYERKGGRGAGLDEEALEKMRENEKRQAELNESQKVKNLKKVARKMEREGKL